MDSSALQTILNHAASNISAFERLDVSMPAVVIPRDNRVESIEHLMASPYHHRNCFKTNVLDDFCLYTNENRTDTTVVYIDVNSMRAKAIFDHGNYESPDWGHHRASLALEKTPEYKALIIENAQNHTQQCLIDFCTDWKNNIQFFEDNGDDIEFQTAINRIRKLTVKSAQSIENQQGDFAASKSAMESVEVTAGADKIPAYFQFVTSPYDGFKQKVYNCSIRALTGDKLTLKYRIEQLEAIQTEIADELKEKLNDALKGMTTYLGTVEHQTKS